MTSLKERFIKAKRELFDVYYKALNEKQREAVYSVNGNLLVLAGAGSGKTSVLVNRIAHIIRFGNAYEDESLPEYVTESDVEALRYAKVFERDDIGSVLTRYAVEPSPAWAILAITFTNKAANEMKERLSAILGSEVNGRDGVTAGTFHSVCVRILRRFGEKIGVDKGFTIYDTDDSLRVIKTILKEMNLDDKMYQPKMIASVISGAKNKLEGYSELSDSYGKNTAYRKIPEIFDLYRRKLSEANAVDFDDIICKTIELLKNHRDVREYYQRKYKYVSVDEYQDTNYAQFVLTELLSGGHHNLMVVGDEDQSIYRFRGATISNILDFSKIFEDSRVVKLEENYRSTGIILDSANSVISHNSQRHGKRLWTGKGLGDKITLCKLADQNFEAEYIVGEIKRRVEKEGRKYKDFAILYRVNAQSNALEKIFARRGIPYRILGGTRFYSRKEIKDILAYLSLINNGSDNLRLTRIINEPKRKIGNVTLEALAEISEKENASMLDIARRASEYTAISRSATQLEGFARLIDELRVIASEEKVSRLIEKTLELSGYERMLREGDSTERERLDNIYELITNAIDYENVAESPSLEGFLEEVSLVADVDEYSPDEDAAIMMTIHSAKGLEFPIVFLPGMEEGLFPSHQAMMEAEEIEEERRLAYVAITRAKEKLYITTARERLFFGMTQYNQMSRFVKEIPTKNIDLDDRVARKMPLGRSVNGMPFSDFDDGEDYFGEKSASRPSGDYSGYGTNGYGGNGYGGNGRYNTGVGVRGGAASYGNGSSQPVKKPSEQSAQREKAQLFAPGDRVYHRIFKSGTILSVTPMASDAIYEIAFDDVGTKKLMASAAKLQKG